MTEIAYDKNFMAGYINAAVQDGWEAAPGPWGSNEHEHTIELSRHVPELDGTFTVWFVDRNMGTMYWDETQRRWAHDYSDPQNDMRKVNAWFTTKLSNGANRQTALNVSLGQVADAEYTLDFWKSLLGICDFCGKSVDYSDTTHLAFANTACKDCVDEAREKVEFPGWTN